MNLLVMGKPGVKVREQAVRALQEVIHDHRSLDEVIPVFNKALGSADRALMQAMCYGVMRWLPRLEAWADQFIAKPEKQVSQPVRILILLGLYQLLYTRIPAHAAIHATVECAPHLKQGRAKAMVNAVLRNFQRRREQLEAKINEDAVAKYAHPAWMLTSLQSDWPNDWRAITEANNQQAPMTLRLDCHRMDRAEYLQQLQAKGLTATAHPLAPEAIMLQTAVNVEMLPGFDAGYVSVQDAAAQLAVPLLRHNSSHRVLDACAAPGGKTAHILQREEPKQLDALDISMARLEKLESMFARIQRKANIIEGDAGNPETWWDGQAYDRILLDAPCSASGVIRRHPDIKHHRSKKALQRVVKRQAQILNALWSLLAPGGILVYVTCSIFKVENELQIKAFIESRTDVAEDNIDAGWGRGDIGKQILPGEADMDGFYFVTLIKKEA